MDFRFFTDPRFLGVLRFWEAQRGRDAVPLWREGMEATFPREIAPDMIAARARVGGGDYLFVGAACVRRFGVDPRGRRLDEFLRGSMLAYVLDVARSAREHGAPVFSYCLYHLAGEEPLRTARVFAPFAPDVMVTLQLYAESPVPLARYSREGHFEEVVRRCINTGGETLRQLEQAARLHRLGRALHITAVADELATAARAFGAEATTPLPVLRDRERPEDGS